MECDKENAIRARETAEKKMLIDDFQEALKVALEAKKLFPELENISQLLAVCDVHCSAQKRICGSEKDWYQILQVERLADESTIKKQYRKLALLLHPDKNKFPGAEAAFKLIGEANMVLSDIKRRLSFDVKHRASEIAAVPKAPPRQRNKSFVVKKAKEVKTMNPDVSTKASNKQPTIPGLFSFMEALSCPLCKCQYPVRPVHRVNHCPNCFRANVFGPQGAPPVSDQNNIRAQGNDVVSQQKEVPVQASRVPVQSTGKFPNSGLHYEANTGKTFVPKHVKQTGGTTEVGAKTRKYTCSHVGNGVNLGQSFGAERMKQTVSTTEVNGGTHSKVKDVDGRDGKVEVANAKGGTTEVGAKTRKYTCSHVGNGVNLGQSFGAESMKQTVSTTEVNGGTHSKVKDVDGRDGKVEVANAKVSGTSANKNRKKRKLAADSSESYDMSTSDNEEESFKGSKGNPTTSQNLGQESIHSSRRSSRQRKNISYNESAGDDDDDFIMGPSEKNSKDGEDRETFSTDKHKATSAAHVPPAAVVDEYPDPEFTDFDKIRNQNCVSINQIWACYDTVDGMPRFYAEIRKVDLPDSKLCIAWLEADPEKQDEIEWVNEDLPVGCGKFTCVDTEETIDCHTLSHLVGFEKVNNRDTYIIYPRKGETWALFKDWDIGWSSEPDSRTKYRFEIVEVLSDFCHDIGIEVGFLVKIKGFVSLFRQTSEGAASVLIPSSELLRFSHQVPSVIMTGSEGAGVPRGSFELDPAALPTDPNAL